MDPVARRYDALHAEIQSGQFPSLAAVFIYFKDFAYLRHTLTAFPRLKTLALATGQDVTYCIMCHRSDAHPFPKVPKKRDKSTYMADWVGINPATMKTSGLYFSYDINVLNS